MKKDLVWLSLLLLLSALSACGPGTQTPTWQSLFNGKSLDGWFVIPGGSWEVQEGVIIGTSTAEEQRHGLLVTEERYRDFVLKLEFKCLKGNSGLYFRVDTVASNVSVNGFQAEIDARNDIGGLYETGGRQWVVQPTPEQVQSYFKMDDWNRMQVSAEGRHIAVSVNGVTTAELVDDPGRLEGFIGLQLHGGMEMHVMFRNIEIRVL